MATLQVRLPQIAGKAPEKSNVMEAAPFLHGKVSVLPDSR